jgi:signal transduction histidine kinase
MAAVTTVASLHALRSRVAAAWSAERTWSAALHLWLSAVLGPLWFAVLCSGLAFMVFPPVGLPAAVGAVALARQGAIMERGRVRVLLGVDISEPYLPLPEGSPGRRLRAAASDPATWRDLAAMLLLLPIGIVAVAALALPALAVAALTLPAWDGVSTISILAALVGLLVLPFLPFAWRGLATAHEALLRGLLGPTRASLSARVATLADSRARAVDAAEAERRRIERDLHDGAQQRLVALAMDLGMAKERFATDPQGARELVEQAHDEAKRALVELRDLARGIHPAVLTDRGLDAALSSLAGRSPVPVEVDVRLDRRPPPTIEAAAYFVVAEALTNVARHSAATAATVSVVRDGDRLVVEVGDDGVGGARVSRGSGLRGLEDRLAAVDGRLLVTSPPGGPTCIRAELPCAW